jgi:hypothetical protein
MNVDIANIILGTIDHLPWLDKYAGMTRTVVQTQVGDGTKPVKKYFPVACNVTDSECVKQGTLKDLVPDTKYKSILYFEDNGTQVLGSDARFINLRSTLRLVSWLNGKKLGYDGCSISSIAVISILKEFALLFNPFNNGNFVNIKINAISEEVKSPNIFSKYSYDESTTQYLMHPFDYFALNIQVNFSVPFNCVDDFELLTPDPC